MLFEGSCALDWDGAAGFELSEGRRNAKIWLLPVLASSHTKVRFSSPAVFLWPRIAPRTSATPLGGPIGQDICLWQVPHAKLDSDAAQLGQNLPLKQPNPLSHTVKGGSGHLGFFTKKSKNWTFFG